MSHVDDGQLNALLDNELPEGEARDVQTHLAGCAECARRLEEARAFLAGAGELLAVLTPSGMGMPQAPPVASVPFLSSVPPVSPVSPVTRAEDIGLAPLSRGPAASGSTRKSSERISEPAIAKTSKEIAINIDGRTAMTPAIRPVTRRGMPAVPGGELRPLNLEKLAWAASLVLALGVGYLANEVYRLKHSPRSSELAVATDATRPPAPAEPARSTRERLVRPPAPTSSPAQQSGSGGMRTAPSTSQPRRAAGPTSGFADAAKPPGARASKPAPRIAQPTEALSANAPATSPLAGASGAGSVGAADRMRSAEARRGEQPASPGTLPRAMNADASTSFHRITLEEAVRRLSGSIRLVDGLQPSRVEAGPGRLVQGADPERDIVRITYTDPRGSRIVLDQQIGDVRTGSFNGLMQGDTLVTATEVGGTRVRWVDRKFWLSLTGIAGADSVRALVERVR